MRYVIKENPFRLFVLTYFIELFTHSYKILNTNGETLYKVKSSILSYNIFDLNKNKVASASSELFKSAPMHIKLSIGKKYLGDLITDKTISKKFICDFNRWYISGDFHELNLTIRNSDDEVIGTISRSLNPREKYIVSPCKEDDALLILLITIAITMV